MICFSHSLISDAFRCHFCLEVLAWLILLCVPVFREKFLFKYIFHYYITLREKCQIRSNFWSLFSLIRTEYGEILCISPYSVRMRESTDQKLLRIWTLFSQRTLVNLDTFFMITWSFFTQLYKVIIYFLLMFIFPLLRYFKSKYYN